MKIIQNLIALFFIAAMLGSVNAQKTESDGTKNKMTEIMKQCKQLCADAEGLQSDITRSYGIHTKLDEMMDELEQEEEISKSGVTVLQTEIQAMKTRMTEIQGIDTEFVAFEDKYPLGVVAAAAGRVSLVSSAPTQRTKPLETGADVNYKGDEDEETSRSNTTRTKPTNDDADNDVLPREVSTKIRELGAQLETQVQAVNGATKRISKEI